MPVSTNREGMLRGELYDPFDPELGSTMNSDDACIAPIRRLVQQEQAFTDVSVELGP